MVATAKEESFPRGGTDAARLAYLSRYAVLAPSSHNSQPWRLVIGDGQVDVYADLSRWLQVADADRRELHISIGCAIENLVVAAAHFGESYSLELFPDAGSAELIARIRLTHGPVPPTLPGLFEAIPRRRTNHQLFTSTPVPAAVLERLCAACAEPGIGVHAISSEAPKAAVQDMVVAGTRKEFADPAFRRELGDWVGRGVLGTPRPLAPLARLAVTHVDMGALIARQEAARFASAPAIILVASAVDDPRAQVSAGRVVERVWLAAVHAGLALQPVSQPLQVPEVRRHLRDALEIPEPWPQHLFRVGYATGEDRRRPVRDLADTVMVTGA
ncbi:MAG TPA: nitroreductase family protein [Longimicrobiales bacterium]|nr:nitroreductase family protein [Longimicrobiales bacterium]